MKLKLARGHEGVFSPRLRNAISQLRFLRPLADAPSARGYSFGAFRKRSVCWNVFTLIKPRKRKGKEEEKRLDHGVGKQALERNCSRLSAHHYMQQRPRTVRDTKATCGSLPAARDSRMPDLGKSRPAAFQEFQPFLYFYLLHPNEP